MKKAFLGKPLQWIIVSVVLVLLSGCTIRHMTKQELEQGFSNQLKKQVTDSQTSNSANKTYNPIEVKGPNDQADLQQWIQYENIPLWVRKIFFDKHYNQQYTFDFVESRPMYLRGDFSGDNSMDVAIMVKDKTSKTANIPIIAIFHPNSPNVAFVRPKGLDTADIWYVVPKSENIAGPGEGIVVEKARSRAKFIYWDGNQYDSEWIGK